MRRLLLTLFALVLPLSVVALGVAGHLALRAYDQPGPLARDTALVIPRGSGVAAIGRLLSEEGVLDEPRLFEVAGRVERVAGSLRAGEYLFPAAVSMREVVEILRAGETLVRRITFPEGRTSTALVALLNAADGLTGTIAEIPAEGSLLPETYHYSLEDSRQEILERSLEAQSALLAELWPKRQQGLPLASPEEAVILASIVERETGVGAERPLVAGVFINRLRKGMRLQSDPTVSYGITLGKAPLGRGLTRKDLNTPTPYNTYAIAGLPPGPIANPGRASLEAVLNPAQTPYLYFVADGTGGHAFAKTLAEHNRNVAKWRKIQRQQQQGGAN